MDSHPRLHSVRFGLLFGLLTILYGWGLGAVFGIDEHGLRDRLFVQPARAARAIYLEKAKGDEEAADAAIKRMDESGWRYVQRAHFHAGGIGAIAIGGSLLLALLSVSARAKAGTSLLLGLGGLGYALAWMLTAMRAPSLGSVSAAKEATEWLAIPSAGGLLIGALLLLVFVVSELFVTKRPAPASGENQGSSM